MRNYSRTRLEWEFPLCKQPMMILSQGAVGITTYVVNWAFKLDMSLPVYKFIVHVHLIEQQLDRK